MKKDSENVEKIAEYKRNELQTPSFIHTKQEPIGLREQVQPGFFSRAAENLGHFQQSLLLRTKILDSERLTQLSWADNGGKAW